MKTAIAILLCVSVALPLTAGTYSKERNIRIIKEVARQEGVDPAVALAFAKKESEFNGSGFNRNLKGTGEKDIRESHGLYQTTFATAKAFGAKSLADLYDPRKSATYGIRFIKYLMIKFPGASLHTIAQMYNLGEPRFFKGKTAIRYANTVVMYYNGFSQSPGQQEGV